MIENIIKDMVESNTTGRLTDASKSMSVHKQNAGCSSYMIYIAIRQSMSVKERKAACIKMS